jgi:exodeoxyribonuclease VII large subunit
MPHIFSINEITTAVKDVLEGQFPFVWVRGQVGNVAVPASGHVYFSLRDEHAVLSAVWFRDRQRDVEEGGHDPVTGEVFDGGSNFMPEEGQEVLCAGSLNVYPPRGQYQIIIEFIQEQGIGDLHMQFEAMKQKLVAKGWFSSERKRQLPPTPSRIALITSKKGAAVRDFLRILSERGAGSAVRLYPCTVQGDKAPGEIAAAVRQAGEDAWAEVVIVIRGGGSLEDLWAFNTEEVAAAVVESPVPVVSGVGHEIDTTIIDLVADVRAATPSHAAQLLLPQRRTLVQRLDETELKLFRSFAILMQNKEAQLERSHWALGKMNPRTKLEDRSEKLFSLYKSLKKSYCLFLERKNENHSGLSERLKRSFGSASLVTQLQQLETSTQSLHKAFRSEIRKKEQHADGLRKVLEALSPEAPLQRGYSLVTKRASGELISSLTQAKAGDAVDIALKDGTLPAIIEPSASDGDSS